MSLHLGSSKYDEHTVRKGISSWHFDHQVSKGVSIPCTLSASQVTVKYVCCHASLGDKAAEPRHVTSVCPTIKMLLPITLPSKGCLALHRSSQSPSQHPQLAPSWSPQERGDVPPGSGSAHSRGCCLLWAEEDGTGTHRFCWGSQQSWEQGKRGLAGAAQVHTVKG